MGLAMAWGYHSPGGIFGASTPVAEFLGAVPFTVFIEGLKMSSLKWIVGVPAAIVVVVVLKISMPPDVPVPQKQKTSDELSFTSPDSSGKSSYLAPAGAEISEREKWEYAAKECWKSYENKSNTPMDKAQIASFCEGLDKRAAESR